MTSKTGGLREFNWTLADYLNTILPKNNVPNKARAEKILPKFQHAEDHYLDSFERGEVYETENDAKLDSQDGKFVVDKMYKSWFVKSDIFDEIRVLTDYCSYRYFSNVDELDHYYDKHSYPEVAVLPENLVPSCESCNQRKKSGAKYFQPYFEDISEYQWLYCTFKYTEAGEPPIPEYRLQRPSDMQPELYQRLEAQLRGTVFIKMDNQSGQDELSGRWEGWKELMSILTIDELKNYLQKTAGVVTEQKGRNHWDSVLYNSLVDQINMLID